MQGFGKKRNVAKFRLMDESGAGIDGVYFGEAEEFASYVRGKERISVTYYPEINRYMGRESIQAVVQNYC